MDGSDWMILFTDRANSAAVAEFRRRHAPPSEHEHTSDAPTAPDAASVGLAHGQRVEERPFEAAHAAVGWAAGEAGADTPKILRDSIEALRPKKGSVTISSGDKSVTLTAKSAAQRA